MIVLKTVRTRRARGGEFLKRYQATFDALAKQEVEEGLAFMQSYDETFRELAKK